MSKISGTISYSNSGKIIRQIASPINRSAPINQSNSTIRVKQPEPNNYYNNSYNSNPETSTAPNSLYQSANQSKPFSSRQITSKMKMASRQNKNYSDFQFASPPQTTRQVAPKPMPLPGYRYHDNIAPPRLSQNTQLDQQKDLELELPTQPLKQVHIQPQPKQYIPEQQPELLSEQVSASQEIPGNLDPSYQEDEIDSAILQHSSDLNNQERQSSFVNELPLSDLENYSNNAGSNTQEEYLYSNNQPQQLKTPKTKSHKRPSIGVKKLGLSKKLIPVVAVFAIVGIAVAGNSLLNGTVNSLKYKIAGSKADINVSAPKYVPAGYTLGTFSYSSHIVSTEFKTVSGKKYSLVQEKSSWNNSQLVSNFVSNTDPNYKTAELKNISVYLYGNGNATWVSGGKWYIIESNGNLSDNQLEDIASSL